jgi:hypothetical protein
MTLKTTVRIGKKRLQKMLFGENLERKRAKNTPPERTLERTTGR